MDCGSQPITSRCSPTTSALPSSRRHLRCHDAWAMQHLHRRFVAPSSAVGPDRTFAALCAGFHRHACCPTPKALRHAPNRRVHGSRDTTPVSARRVMCVKQRGDGYDLLYTATTEESSRFRHDLFVNLGAAK